MSKARYRIWLTITVVFAICLVCYAFSSVVTDPGRVVLALGGDAGKNIFTYLYHSLYENGVWFSGMNYPYGEHVVYTDCQPLLSAILIACRKYFNVDMSFALAVQNLLISASFVLGIVYVWKSLVVFKVAPLRAIIFASLIILMSPQIFRFQGHFALSYICFVPMLFYWSLQYEQTGKNKYPLYLFLLGGIMAFIHPYFGALTFVWIAFYSIGYFLFSRQPRQARVKHIAPLTMVVVGVYALMQGFILLTDPVKDRPIMPYGAFTTITKPEMLVTSVHSYLWRLIYKSGRMQFLDVDAGEGQCYLGIVVVLVSLVAFGCWLRKKFTQRPASYEGDNVISHTTPSGIWLFVAFASLIFAMGIPFVWDMHWLLENTPVLRQFRAMGRFSWLFYYVITIYGVVLLNNWYVVLLQKGKKVLAYSLLLAAIGIWGFEARGYLLYTTQLALGGRDNYNYFSEGHDNWDHYLKDNHYGPGSFQAIIMLPFMHVGSEKLWLGESVSWLFTIAAKASLELHTPIVNVMMSRSSISQAEDKVKLVGGPLTDKPMLRSIHSDKPFLILNFEEDSLDIDQKYLLQASDFIGHFSQCNVYACYPSRIIANDRKYRAGLDTALANAGVGDTCPTFTGTWHANHLNDGLAYSAYLKLPPAKDGRMLNEVKLLPADKDKLYEFSIWAHVSTKDYRGPVFILDQLDSNGNILGQDAALTKQSVDNKTAEKHTAWLRVSKYFKIKPGCATLRCTIGNDDAQQFITLKDCLLKPVDAVIISKLPSGIVMVNNHYVKP